MFYAHSTKQADRSDWQSLQDHLTAVADLAAKLAAPFGAEGAAHLAGSLHDLGKFTKAFQARLDGSGTAVDHSTAGAHLALNNTAQPLCISDRIMAELVSYGIAGHHAGLPDRIADSGSLTDRIHAFDPNVLDPVWRYGLSHNFRDLLPPSLKPCTNWSGFELAFLGRMVFSCLVDADFQDTERFYASIEDCEVDRQWPLLSENLPSLIAQFDAYMVQRTRTDSAVNLLRSEILDHVRSRDSQTPGLFTLNVPTGGGKTLTSLGFALDHARLHGHRRIIYAIPFTSIIDQTAAIFREVLGDRFVLEHHSAIEEEKSSLAREARDKLRLAMENWDAPVIITTNVQLFESLFAARPSRCRKLHNIAGSIIVLDEAQTIPRSLLGPCVRALDVLARTYGCSIVLCTATQPALNASHFAPIIINKKKGTTRPHMLGLPLHGRELAPDPERLARLLKRTQIRFAGAMSNDDLVTALEGSTQGLVIVNSRKHAYEVFTDAREAGLDGLIHLTTRQYAAHRRRILADVRRRLKDGLPCRVIATSLIEAGVDVDFPLVWRAAAGLDQIAQAAGRCNREGRRDGEASVVTVFDAPDYPPPPEIKGLTGDMARMAHTHADLLSPDAIGDYFQEVYWRLGEAGLDKHGVMEKFRLNGGETNFSYRTVGACFRMIESGMQPVIIAIEDEARKAVAELALPKVPSGHTARALQPYIVQVPPKARAQLLASGHVRIVEEKLRSDQFIVLTNGSLYTEAIGLRWENGEYLNQEDLLW